MYAHRSGFPLHRRANDRLRELIEGDVPWGLPVFCIGEFCRVVTHPRILSPPTSLPVALDSIDGILESPSVRLLSPGPRFHALFRRVSEASDARGNLAFDAQIVAVCLEHGATRLLTFDRDFSRFPGIETVEL